MMSGNRLYYFCIVAHDLSSHRVKRSTRLDAKNKNKHFIFIIFYISSLYASLAMKLHVMYSEYAAEP